MPKRHRCHAVHGPRPWLVAAALLLPPALSLAQTLGNTGALAFGSFVAGSGGSVIVAPNGSRSKTGGVVLIGQGASATAAQFSVHGTANAVVSITLPADNTVVLIDDSGHAMPLNAFVASSGTTLTLSGAGAQAFSVGATLGVAGGQPRGSYAGSFNVTVNYP